MRRGFHKIWERNDEIFGRTHRAFVKVKEETGRVFYIWHRSFLLYLNKRFAFVIGIGFYNSTDAKAPIKGIGTICADAIVDFGI